MYLSMYDSDPLYSSLESSATAQHSRMDPYGRPKAGSNPASDRQLQQHGLSRSRSEQKLPPFRDIIPAHLHDAIESTPKSASSGRQSPAAGLPASRPRASPPAATQQSPMPSLSEGFDDFAGRFEPLQPDRSPSRRPSEYLNSQGSTHQYPDEQLSYQTQRPAAHQNNLPTGYRASPSLPSIRSLPPHGERTAGNLEGSYNPSLAPYQSFGHGPGCVSDPESNPYGSRGPSFYDQHSRAFPTQLQMGGSHASGQPEYLRYGQPTYDSSRAQTPFSAPYMDMDFSPQVMSNPQHTNYGVLGDSIDPRSKRRRGNLPKPVTDILRAWFHDHLDHPYPTEEDKQIFMVRTGLSISQISNWFINARRRQLPALRNQVRSQDHERGSQAQSMADGDHLSSQDPSLSPR